MNNADTPATPIWDVELHRCNGLAEEDSIGLTKLEHFAALAPPIPSWFISGFVRGRGKGLNYPKSQEMALFAWPAYYAKAVLAELEEAR